VAALTHGPWLMHAWDTGFNVWFRLNGAGTVRVLAANGAFQRAVTAGTDFCGHVTVTGLPPATLCPYVVEVDGAVVGSYQTVTMPAEGSPGRFALLIVNDDHLSAGAAGNSTAEDIAKLGASYGNALALVRALGGMPVYCLQGGDFEITGAEEDLAQRRLNMQTMRGQPPNTNAFHQRVPFCHIWDDHDAYGNNRPADQASDQRKAVALQVWKEYYAGEPELASPGAVYKAFRIADCLILMLDGRTYLTSSPGSFPTTVLPPDYDPATARVWGDEQLAWIKATLQAHASAPWKFIVSGGTLIDNAWTPLTIGPGKRDSIGIYYRKDRNDLLAWLAANPACAKGLVCLTGDDHMPCVQQPTAWHDPQDHTAAPLSSAVHTDWPLIPDVKCSPMGHREEDNLGGTQGGEGVVLYQGRGYRSYGLVLIDTVSQPPRLDFRIIRADVHRTLYRFDGVGGAFYFPQGQGAITEHRPTAWEADASGQLVPNSGFEDGTIDPWLTDSGVVTIDDETAAADGDFVARLGPGETLTRTPLELGRYRLRGRARVVDAGAAGLLAFTFNPGTNPNQAAGSATVPNDGLWHAFESDAFEVTGGPVVPIIVTRNSGAVDVDVDAFMLVLESSHADPAAPATAYTDAGAVDISGTNPDFETGDFTGWTPVSGCSIVGDPVYSGAKAARIRGQRVLGTPSHGILQRTLALTSGRNCRLSLRVRSEDDSPAGGAPFAVKLDPGDGVLQDVAEVTAQPGSTYREVSVDFQAVGAAGLLHLQMLAPPTAGSLDVYVDGYRLLEGAFDVWTNPAAPATAWS
jgi:hypothetical protein